ncbi:16S rRNA (uracil(1498)-N(3))-methyltransferase [Salicibibacter cibi]|uniref:Ribosomal RNA small subunit methyltransferase E n=1 Tax=Salicibibacter cibi TaxID=2743001 RepID=A0A7T6ZAD1_9BACI|nr:16S rRNA (uracil(1498)-N(3))-methyltransferase [Salicibibacter cibi]QQK79677.1 16S rRNA (uracil(1498)-N(3))-methyltransferase [Salicibibacter cibi]
MQRYFVEDDQWTADAVILKGEQAHHIFRVMRMSPGDVIICINGQGKASYCRITQAEPDRIKCQVEEGLSSDTELPIHITVAQGDLKADKYEWIVQKSTEMGAGSITGFPADHSVVKWDVKKSEKKQARFQKIAQESAEQSERLKIPTIERKTSLEEVLKEAHPYDHKWILSERSARKDHHHAIDDALRQLQHSDRILLVFGPEGGFSTREHETAIDLGCTPVSLGARILRAETAPVATLALLVYQVELKR